MLPAETKQALPRILLGKILYLFLFLTFVSVYSNPFAIDFPAKKEMSEEDYLLLQTTLRRIPHEPINALFRMHPDESIRWPCGRTFAGVNLGMIDPKNGLYPIVQLEKIGKGGSQCIVSYASYNGKYPELLLSSVEALKKTGFNGYIYYRIGGFPNPTGEEVCYAGVPMSFKGFIMQEAAQLGFKLVLWMDAAMIPLKNPIPLFNYIARHGYLILGWKSTPQDMERSMTPAARDSLQEILGIDVYQSLYIWSSIFGLKMNTEEANKFIKGWYQCVRAGTPFVSWFTDQPTFAALVASIAPSWTPCSIEKLIYSGVWERGTLEQAKEGNYIFFWRPHY
jgi:hypothetical protein